MAMGLIVELKNRIEGFLTPFSNRGVKAGEALPDVVRALEETLASVEPRFLDLGQSFQTLFEETRHFTLWVEKTIDMASGKSGESALAGTGDYARDCVDQLKHQQKDMLESLAIFEEVEKGLSDLSRQCADAEKIVLLLKVIVLNIGIESNRARESAEMFQSFVGEVRELSGRVEQVIRSLSGDSEAIRRDHRKTVEEIRLHVSRLTRLADKADQELKESARQIETMMAKTLDSLNANRESGAAMEKHLGDIVMALQMHDIIRQRVDGVVKELYAAGSRIKTVEIPSGVNDTDLVLFDQAEHLDLIIADVEKTYHEVFMSFKGIEHHLAGLYQGVSSRVAESGNLSSEKNPFFLLAGSLKSLNTLIEESYSLSRVVDDRIAQASEKVQTLSGYVKSVEAVSIDLRRKALNAIVKAAHLGDMGRGIEVFAKEVGTASLASNRFAENVIALIAHIRQMVLDLHHGSRQTERNALSENLLTGSENILNAYGRFSENAEKVAGQFEKIEAIIGGAESELVFFEEFSEQLGDYSVRLRRMAEEMTGRALDYSVRKKLEAPGAEVLVGALAAASPMDAPEHHDGAAVNPPSEEPELFDETPVCGSSDENSGQTLGDNVELF